MSFVKFLAKHASELATIGGALDTVADLVTGDKADKAKIRTAADVAKSGAKNIGETISDVKDLIEMKVTKEDIKAAVAELLPEIVAKILAEMTKPEKPAKKGNAK